MTTCPRGGRTRAIATAPIRLRLGVAISARDCSCTVSPKARVRVTGVVAAVLCLLTAPPLGAQNENVVVRVLVQAAGEAVAGASVVANAIASVTDGDGRASLTSASGSI